MIYVAQKGKEMFKFPIKKFLKFTWGNNDTTRVYTSGLELKWTIASGSNIRNKPNERLLSVLLQYRSITLAIQICVIWRAVLCL